MPAPPFSRKQQRNNKIVMRLLAAFLFVLFMPFNIYLAISTFGASFMLPRILVATVAGSATAVIFHSLLLSLAFSLQRFFLWLAQTLRWEKLFSPAKASSYTTIGIIAGIVFNMLVLRSYTDPFYENFNEPTQLLISIGAGFFLVAWLVYASEPRVIPAFRRFLD